MLTTEILRRFDAFVADMRAAEIHVGAAIGNQEVRCCLDGQLWPCAATRAANEEAAKFHWRRDQTITRCVYDECSCGGAEHDTKEV